MDRKHDSFYDAPPGRRPRHVRRRRRPRFPLFRMIVALSAAVVLLHLGSLLLPSLQLPAAGGPFSPGGDFTPEDNSALFEQLDWLAQEEPRAEPLRARPSDYPAQLLELVLRNRETLDFVLDYPEKKDSAPAERVDGVSPGQVPLLLQWDPRWGYAQYGDGLMALNGCGPTALAMVICGLTGDGSVTPYTVAAYADQSGYYVDGAGTKWELMSSGCQHFGLTARELPLSRSSLTGALEQGQPVICSVRAGDFTTSGHFIVLTGLQEGLFQVCDPNRRSNSETLWDYDTLAPQISNLWAYSLSP